MLAQQREEALLQAVRPQRILSSLLRTCEHPIVGRLERRVPAAFQKRIVDELRQRQRH